MKNLKKVLSLVLACTTALTVMAGAAFTDAKDIKATEAVDMLAQLGVINGYEDGSYKPEDTVTRAEMAKMIYVARTGSTEASSYSNVATTFTDINGHWAAGYIKYCQTNGIIAGKSATQFDPDNTVTGTEATKMLLVTMGYTADKAGLVGSTWATNTLALADENGLLDDVKCDISAAIPRQYAAQVIYNTLDADRVKWSTDSGSFDYYSEDGNRETVGQKYLGLYTAVGTLTTLDGKNLTIAQTASQKEDSTVKYTDSTVDFTDIKGDYADLLGQEVKVMYKDKKLNNVLGVYATSNNSVYNVNASALEEDGAKVKFDGKSYSLDTVTVGTGDSAKTYTDAVVAYYTDINGETATAVLKSDSNKVAWDKDLTGNKLKTNDAAKLAFGKGFKNLNNCSDNVRLIDSDGDNKIDTAIITQTLAGEVTYVSDSKVIVDGMSAYMNSKTSYDPADETVETGLTTDDWAIVTRDRYNDCCKISKADKMTGSLTGVKKDETTDDDAKYDAFKIDGTWYNAGFNSLTGEGTTDIKSVKATCDVEAVVVGGVVYKLKKTSGSTSTGSLTDVAMVIATNEGSTSGTSSDEVKLRFFDDTTKVVSFDDNDDKVGDDYVDSIGELTLGHIYEYEISGGDYRFLNTISEEDDNYGDYTYVGANNNLTSETYAGMKIDDNAKVMIYKGVPADDAVQKLEDSDVITGKQFKSSYATMGAKQVTACGFKADMSGLDRIGALAVEVTSMTTTVDSYDNYGYITSKAYTVGSDIAYTIWTGSEYKTVTDTDNNASTMVKGLVIGYDSIDANNVIDGAEAVKDIYRTAITGINDNKTTFTTDYNVVDGQTGTSELDIENDTTVLYVNSDADSDKMGAEEGVIKDAANNNGDYAGYKYTPNALVIASDKDTAELVVYDIAGEIANGNSPYALSMNPETMVEVTAANITGTAKVGETLTAVANDDATNVTYQWKAADVAITGATNATYVVAAADLNKTITVTISGDNGSVVTSDPTTAVAKGVASVAALESTKAFAKLTAAMDINDITATTLVGATVTAAAAEEETDNGGTVATIEATDVVTVKVTLTAAAGYTCTGIAAPAGWSVETAGDATVVLATDVTAE